jgi:hypothetical protein
LAAPIQNYWNAFAEQVAVSHQDDTGESARTFAQVDRCLADATISLYDAEYTYPLATRHRDPRPNTDGNPLAIAAPWTPFATTPADPSCPGAHSTVSAAAASILAARYGDHVPFPVTSPALPGAVRSFDTFHAAATEAGLSRIYAGIHTPLDDQAGLLLRAQIGQYTLGHALDNGPPPVPAIRA